MTQNVWKCIRIRISQIFLPWVYYLQGKKSKCLCVIITYCLQEEVSVSVPRRKKRTPKSGEAAEYPGHSGGKRTQAFVANVSQDEEEATVSKRRKPNIAVKPKANKGAIRASSKSIKQTKLTIAKKGGTNKTTKMVRTASLSEDSTASTSDVLPQYSKAKASKASAFVSVYHHKY